MPLCVHTTLKKQTPGAEPGGGMKRSTLGSDSSPSPPSTYLNSVSQVLPEHKRLLCSVFFLLTAVFLGSTARLISLGLLLLVKQNNNNGK